MGEAAGVVKRAIRDGDGLHALVCGSDKVGRHRLAAELGDVLWFVAALASDLGISPSEVVRPATEASLPLDQSGPDEDDIDPATSLVESLPQATYWAGLLGTELVPDDPATSFDERLLDTARFTLGDIPAELAVAARSIGTSFTDIPAANLETLADRMERGVLQGAGDDR